MKNKLNPEGNEANTKLEEADLDTITGGQGRELSLPPSWDPNYVPTGSQLSPDDIPEDLRHKLGM